MSDLSVHVVARGHDHVRAGFDGAQSVGGGFDAVRLIAGVGDAVAHLCKATAGLTVHRPATTSVVRRHSTAQHGTAQRKRRAMQQT